MATPPGFGSGSRSGLGDEVRAAGVLFPQIRFNTNDRLALVKRNVEQPLGFPLLPMDRYDKGPLHLDHADNFHHPVPAAPEACHDRESRTCHEGVFCSDSTAEQVALFAYDNNTFVGSFLDQETDVKVSVAGRLHQAAPISSTGEVLSRLANRRQPSPWMRWQDVEKRNAFPPARVAAQLYRLQRGEIEMGSAWIFHGDADALVALSKDRRDEPPRMWAGSPIPPLHEPKIPQ